MTEPREPGWYPDPERPATLLRRWDGAAWTDDARPTGYDVQPAGPSPVAAEPGEAGEAGTEMFGAAPAETGGPQAPRRRLQAAVVLTAVVVVAVVVVLLLGVLAG